MPKKRCLGRPGQACNKLIDRKLTRCNDCERAVKHERNRQRAELEGGWPGAKKRQPCPQTGLCAWCGEAAFVDGKGPFVWGHYPTRFIDGGKTVVPIHRKCNESYMRQGNK